LQRSLLGCSTSFRAEVERARVREAERLLTEGDEKVEVIARRVGCASPSHFAALFRRTTGEAPADFRGRRRR
jgi:AraC-like DNA-binding protein